MHLTKRFHVLSLAVVAVGAMALPASASAANEAACAFTGVAGNISPGVQFQGGNGRYDFESGAVGTQCNYNNQGWQNSKIKSSGGFDNVQCGTGSARSPHPTYGGTTTVDYGANGSNEVTSASYRIDFQDAQGRLKISSINGSAEDSTGPKDPTDNQEIDGHVSIVPTADPNNPTTCTPPGTILNGGVTQFQVVGAFTVKW
ncbi:MAG TPA: hypothetical protein VHF51_18730 [Solirubrobacteraceae bacterium]|nr:hypothetical protein [Solirubrobacteraceae bacterium]